MQLRKDKRALREVWDWREELVKSTKELLPEQRLAYEQYRNMSVTAQRMANPAVSRTQEFVSRMTKDWLMKRDQAGDAQAGYLEQKLVYWGYETAPVTRKGIETLEGIIRDMGYDQNPQALELRDPRRARPNLYSGLSNQGPTTGTSEPIEEDAQWLQKLRSGG